ncbi:UPF0261 family protein [Paenibacillus sp. S3N08]|uniref:UPF0261 family protein n=2 Tax=Paenibacillus agricola TaxID=2716264 RepID=A0ABX0JIS5_9BACL|nr:UPF0261 family protein [Paenibacillus agricola]
MAKKAVLIGALDTKGQEFSFVRNILQGAGIETLVMDTGVLGTPVFTPDISSDEVAVAGGTTVALLREEQDRGKAIAAMTSGVAKLVARLVKEDAVAVLFGMGGSAGTTVSASAMQAAPVGIPKLLVSTVASGNTRPYVGEKDVMMMYSVIDIAGLNSLSIRILRNAAYALIGMVQGLQAEAPIAVGTKPMLGMTMFGVTTPCCTQVRESLEAKGYEVLVFHATGTGGRAMEDLIRSGFIQGVLDITTTELADDLVGGIFTAGPTRMDAAGERGIPQIVSVGALDMVNFGPSETVPPQFKDRTFYQHNPTTTLMRTTVEENRELGKRLAQKLNNNAAQTVVIFPHGGVSLLDMDGKPFAGVAERMALFEGLKSELSPEIFLIETDGAINDPAVAERIATEFLTLFNK